MCVNEHHANAYGLMPSPNLMAAALTRRTSRAQIPPDLVVKLQPIDIADVILQMILRLRIMYQQEIKG